MEGDGQVGSKEPIGCQALENDGARYRDEWKAMIKEAIVRTSTEEPWEKEEYVKLRHSINIFQQR